MTAVLIAAVGTLLVYLYVQRADDRALAGQHPVEVLVAARTVEAGTSAGEAFNKQWLKPQTLPEQAVADGAVSSVVDISEQVARTRIYPGQQIVKPLFGAEAAAAPVPFTLPDKHIAMSFEFDATKR